MSEVDKPTDNAIPSQPILTPNLDDGGYWFGNVRVRPALAPFCKNMPLLPSEDAEAYVLSIVSLADRLKGFDIIGRFFVQDAVDWMFKVQQLKRTQTILVLLEARKINSVSGGQQGSVESELTPDEKLALAYMANIGTQEQLDRMIEHACTRRDAAIARLEKRIAAAGR
jgi:hypothetical protein